MPKTQKCFPGPLLRAWLIFFLALAPSSRGANLPAQEKWESLFDGKDLAGWAPENGALFSATNGCLHLAKSTGWLRTERQYTNFILMAEWRALETNYNSGFFLRAGRDGAPYPTEVWQVNLRDTALGSLMRGSKTVVRATTPRLPFGQWFTFRMEVRGHVLALYVNDERAWEFDGFDASPGYIGLQAENKAFDFRSLRVRELP